jgi:hypothetical protein
MYRYIRRTIALALLLFFSCYAQAQTSWTIGSGVAANTFGSGNNPYPCPFGNYFSGMRAQYIYRASELTAAGMTAGLIHQLAWNVTNVGTSGAHQGYTLSIKGITANSLTSWQTNMLPAYSAASYQPVSGWNTFTLSAPFSWNGTDNIVVEVCFWNGSLNYSDNARVQWTTGLGANTSIDYYDDYGGPFCGQNNLVPETYGRRPNIRFTRMANCSGVPTAGTASAPSSICPAVAFNLTVTGGTNGGNMSYQWQSSPTPTGTFTDIPGATTANYVMANGINAATSFRLVVTCISSGQSATSNVVTVSLNNYLTCFCTPTYTDGCEYGDDINTITLTGALGTGINQVNNPCPGLNAYTDYTSLAPTKMAVGTSYSGTINTEFSDEGVKFWIDFNNNGLFEASEVMTSFDGVAESPLTSSYTLNIPATAPLGLHRMRVRLVYYDPVAADIDPCAEHDYGEARDYNVRILPHAPTISLSASPVCEGGSVTLTAVPSGNTGANPVYIWTGPNGYTATGITQTLNNITLAQAGTYTARVVAGTDTSAAGSAQLAVNPKPAGLTAGSNSPLCAGATLNLTSGSTSAGVAYTWTGPNAFSAAQQNPSVTNVTTAAAGIYKVKASLNGCLDSAVTTVVVNPSPAGVTAGNNGPLCAGGTLNLTGSSTTSGVSYSWAGPNSFSAAQQNPSISNATTAATGTYTLTAALGSCTTTATTNAVVNPIPAGVTASSNSPVCAGSTLNLTGASTTSGVSYSWSGPNTYSSATQNPSITNVSIAAAGTYTLTASAGSCSTTATTTVVIKPTPAGVTATNNGPLCAGSTLNLIGNSTTGGVSYSWSGPNAFSSALQNPSVANATTAASGLYILTANLNGCTRTTTTTVIVNANPVAIATASGPTTICQGDFVTLQANTGAGLSYQWKRNGTNVGTGIAYNASVAGNYTVTVTNTNGCSAISAPVTVTVIALPPATITHNTPLSFCDGQSVTLHAPTGAGFTYTWYQDGSAIPGATTDTYVATQEGIYSLRVTAGTGCTSLSSPVSVTVFPVLTPIISRNGNMLSSSGYVSYQWYFNNMPVAGAVGADFTITQNGYYQVLGTDANGCTSTSAIAWIQNLGMDSYVKADDIKIFPNPATTEVHIVSPVRVNVVIRNMQGQVVLSGRSVTTMNISSLAAGVYMISILDKDNALLKTGRLVKAE